jgi:hypothetical protein
MRLASWNWFWYVLIGFVMGGGLVYLQVKLKEMNLKFVWYEWVLTVVGILLFIFLGQTFIASFNEFEPRAAWMSLIFMGFPIVIVGVIVYRSVQKRTTQKA